MEAPPFLNRPAFKIIKLDDDDAEPGTVSPPTDREPSMTKYCEAYSDLSFATFGTAFPHGHDTYVDITTSLLAAAPSSDEIESEVSGLIEKGLLPQHRVDVADGKVVSVEQARGRAFAVTR